MIRAIIVDDEIPVLNLLKMCLNKTEQVDIIGAFTDPFEALDNINKTKPDVVFLDIEMPDMNGLELASHLIENNDELMVVFVTGYNQYALEAFQVNALDYILKPVNPNKIQKCISRLIKLKLSSNVKELKEVEKKICCFGEFEIYGDNGLVKWATRKVEEMLAYFIVYRDSNIEGWILGEILWPNEEPKKIKTNLHTTLFRLRKTIREEGLPIEISSEKGGKGIYRCTLGQLSCDLAGFEEIVVKNITINKNNINELEKVCSLYRDDLFSKKNYEWSENKKESLKQCYINMLKNMGQYYKEQDLHENAIDKLRIAERIAPFDEEIHRSLLRAYYARKNKALIIKCYQEFRQRLLEEIGVEPEVETKKLFAKLIAE